MLHVQGQCLGIATLPDQVSCIQCHVFVQNLVVLFEGCRKSRGSPAVTRAKPPAFPRNPRGRLGFPGPTQGDRDGEAWWAAIYGVAQSRTLQK